MWNKKYEIVEMIVPNWTLGALINGDMTGLTDDEYTQVDIFVNETVDAYGNGFFIFKEEVGFCHRNDMDNLGSDCSKVMIVASKESISRILTELNSKLN